MNGQNNKPLLESVLITNYMACGGKTLTVPMGPSRLHTIVGKNNSGKTMCLSTLSLLKRSFRGQGLITGRNNSSLSLGQSSAPEVTAELFHGNSNSFQIEYAFSMGLSHYELGTLVKVLGLTRLDEPKRIEFELTFRERIKFLSRIRIDGIEIFAAGRETPFIKKSGETEFFLKTGSTIEFQKLIGVLEKISSDLMFIPSTRSITSSGDINLEDDLASGSAIVPWVKQATNPDYKNRVQRERSSLLTEFNRVFGRFIGAPDFRLSVSEGNHLQVSIEGLNVPISSLGTGISECLLILLASRIASNQRSSFHSIVLEEPELHLHPGLQRELIKMLNGMGVKLIVSTHSSSVISEMSSLGASMIQTRMLDIRKIEVREVKTDSEILDLLEDIGVSAADALNAELAIWVEGPTDVPIFREWIRKISGPNSKRIAVLPVGGSAIAAAHFQVDQLVLLNRNSIIILDSERTESGGNPAPDREVIRQKLEAAGISFLFTERRCTENYFTKEALAKALIGKTLPQEIDPFVKLNDQIPGGLSKNAGFRVAREMTLEEIVRTDVGAYLAAKIRQLP